MSDEAKNNDGNLNDDVNTNQESDPTVAMRSRNSQVVSHKGGKQVIGIAVMVIVIGLIFTLMFMGSKKPVAPAQQSAPVIDNSTVLAQNAARLAKLQHDAARPKSPLANLMRPQKTPQSGEPDKALLARQNAPTQMYSGALQHTVSDAQNKSNTSTLAGKNSFAQFAGAQGSSVSVVTGKRLTHPDYTIAEGDFIHAVLETAINSDLPGMVRAVVTKPVYAYTDSKVMIPAGSRLIGQYDTTSSNGLSSSRIFVMWNRVITPGGVSIMINSPGTDTLGRAGQGANSVDTHFFRMFGTASLLSVIGAVTSTMGVGSYDQPNSANQYRSAVGNAFQQSAQNAMNSNLKIKPTLYIHQGDAINVFVARDLDLYNVLGEAG